ncbi:unnamed protein product [Mycena citricolor]|uniref:BZIP domain-containing protein n=1 Tax=Mycena citricolor TaxID=2018698 RepID=A0AAD2GZ11_9AGAR|nr:unnamed protein product [Mycena citricolor]CAK5280895.1 unnamed protein product [Mycena citricolor]
MYAAAAAAAAAAYPQQLDYGMQEAYYSSNGHYSADSSPSSPSHSLPSMSMVGPQRTHPSIAGMRKRYDMVPISDAPTAPRNYVTPSSTSRKDIPSFFANRRPTSQPSDEEEDELADEVLPANATDQERIEYKRRQNTLAARRSRKRKMLHQQHLQDAVERLTREKEIWRTRALTLSNLLRNHGITCPDFPEV